MAYVGSPFEHDVFVSYSHGADSSGEPFLQPWSAKFVEALEKELRFDRRFRDTLRLFLDQDHRPGKGVDPMAPLTDQLREQIGASALLVVLMSPDYLASKWCTQERDWWYARQTKLGLSSSTRVAVVRILPTQDPWPSQLMDSAGQQLVGFSFFAGMKGVERPLGWTDLPGGFGSDFKKALLDIVARLNTELDAAKASLDDRRRAEAEASKLAQAGGQSIYLHGRADQAKTWERAAVALGNGGFAVVPGEPDPIEQDPKRLQEVRERRVEALSACDALLLVGTEDGRALDADLVVVGKHDRQSARARSNNLLPCGLLDTVGAPIATAVRKTTARIVQADWLDATRPEWPAEIGPWLLAKSAQAGPS